MSTGRVYDVVALRVPIVYDAYGDHDRNGMIYTLAEHEAELRALWAGFPEPFPDPVIGGLSCGSVRTLSFTAGPSGDYAYRTGVLRWALTEGLWGIIRTRRHER